MELAFGRVITFDDAARLGVLSAAEGLKREGPDKAWIAISPVDAPEESGKDEEMSKSNVSLYRALHHLNKGGLHRALGVPEDQDIPADKLQAAKSSKNEHIRHMANFASTMGQFQK